MTLQTVLRDEALAVFLGTGGVGKTTLAAGAAIRAAGDGRRVALITIDPARRLADALGLESLRDLPRPVPLPGASGSLEAMMLAPERTFDRLVERYAGSREAQHRILENGIYRHLSRSLAGSAEYAAMERVHELLVGGTYDLIVVDTPPSQHALDFLDAPQRLLWLFESSVLRNLLHPAFVAGRFGMQWFGRATSSVFKVLERVTGVGFLEEVSEFLLAFEGISVALQEHAEEVRESLRRAAFVVVAAPSPQAAAGAERFWDRLVRDGSTPSGVLWNRCHPMPAKARWPAPDEPAIARALEAAGVDTGRTEWARAAARAAHRYGTTAAAEIEATRALCERAAQEGGFVHRVPELSEEIHDLAGLSRLAGLLGRRRAEDGDAASA